MRPPGFFVGFCSRDAPSHSPDAPADVPSRPEATKVKEERILPAELSTYKDKAIEPAEKQVATLNKAKD